MNPATPNPSIHLDLPVREAQIDQNASPALTLDFFRAALVTSFVAGILPGAWMLLLQAGAGTFAVAPIHWIQIHARAQVMGLLLCFIMGFGYQAFPRFRGIPLRWPGLARASLPLLLAGLGLRFAAELAADTWSGARALALLGAVFELLAVVAFVVVVMMTGRRATTRVAKPGATSHAGFVISAAVWLLISVILGLPEAWFLGGQSGTSDLTLNRSVWEPTLRDVQLHGMVLLMIAGVSQRLLPGFLSLPPDASGRAVQWLPWLNLAVLAEVVGDSWVARTDAPLAWALREVGIVILAVGVFSILVPLGIFSRRAAHSPPRPFVLSAGIWLGVSLLLQALPPLNSALFGRGASHGLMDAARHAFTMGFAMMTVMGISWMVGPALSVKPRMPLGPLRAAYWLLNGAVALRVGSEVLSDVYPWAYGVAGLSGILALAGFLFWAVPLWRCISGPLPGAKWAKPTPA